MRTLTHEIPSARVWMEEASNTARSRKENDRPKDDDSSALGFDIRPKSRLLNTRILSRCCNRVLAKCCKYLSSKNSIQSVDLETWRSIDENRIPVHAC